LPKWRLASLVLAVGVATLTGCARDPEANYQTEFLSGLEDAFRAGRITRATYEGERARVLGYPDPNKSVAQPNPPLEHATDTNEIPLQAKGKALYLPVRINGTITIPFLLDTGAEELALPVDVATTLMRAGALGSRDVLGEVGVVLADGSKQVVPRISIREVKVGNQTLKDVPATVSPSTAEPLFGQAFLSRFGSVTVDYRRDVLVLRR
jgi:predicted aspartyl protease